MYGPKNPKRAFYSKVSMQDAVQQCVNAGYQPIGKLVNKHHQNICFGRLIQGQNRSGMM
jgi:hypothetical protein